MINVIVSLIPHKIELFIYEEKHRKMVYCVSGETLNIWENIYLTDKNSESRLRVLYIPSSWGIYKTWDSIVTTRADP